MATPLNVRASLGDMLPRFVENVTVVPFCTGVPELSRTVARISAVPLAWTMAVFVDKAAKQIVAFDLRVGRSSGCVSRFGRDERERAMRPLRVVVGHVAAKHVLEVASAEDQQPVETLGARSVRTNRSA